jgi:demethylspheroidene O-methyltransferase
MSWIPERLLQWRDRRLADADFQHRAGRFPLTRPIARRRAAALFDITAGFVYSQVLAACVQLDLFERLAEGPRTVAALAADVGVEPGPMLRLLQAASSLELLQRRGRDSFGLGDLGAASLGNPGIAAMVRHHQQFYRDLADPVALLKGDHEAQLASFWPYARQPAGEADDYSELMAASQAFLVREILTAFPLRNYEHLWDIAGGDGFFVAEAVRRWPQLRGAVMDLPPVAARARARFERDGLSGRADALGGNLFETPLGRDLSAPDWEPKAKRTALAERSGPNLVTLIRVLHDHDDERALQLLQTLRAGWPTGARLLIAEPMAETPRAEPMGHAYFGFYLMAMGSGRPRSLRELRGLLEQAGFTHGREVATGQPLLLRILVAEPAETGVKFN